jgi:hypothetical protein
MQSLLKHISTTILVGTLSANSLAHAQSLSLKDLKVPLSKPIEIKKPPVDCLSCPDLSKLPRLRAGLSQEERLDAIREIDEVVQDLKDLPDVSPEILTSVDYWERLRPAEKEVVLGHKFGSNVANWGAAAVAVAVVALAYEVAKDYTNRWRPGEGRFDALTNAYDLNYIKSPALKLAAVDMIRMRLDAFTGLSQVARGLNY